MKTKTCTKGLLLFACACATTLFFSCQKTIKDKSPDQGIDAATQNSIRVNSINTVTSTDNSGDDIFDLVMDNELSHAGVLHAPCAIRTYNPSRNVYPHTVTVDFGTGCTDQFGRVKKGKVITTYSAPISTWGSTSVTTYQDFYIDDARIEGRNVVENTTAVGDTYPHFSHLIEKKRTYPNGEYSREVSDKVFVQTEGANTEVFNDDGFTIYGESTGTIYAFGLLSSYTASIDQNHPIHHINACEFADAGVENTVVYVGTTLLATASLDYGNGACDNDAVLTTNNISVHVTLPLKLWPF